MGIHWKKNWTSKFIYQHLFPKIPPFSYYTVLAFTSHFRTWLKGKYLAHTYKAIKNPHIPAIWYCGTTEIIFNIYLCRKRYIHSISLQWVESLLHHFTEGYCESCEFCIYLTLPKLRTWCSQFWVSRAAKEGHNWPARQDINTFGYHHMNSYIHLRKYTDREKENMQEWVFTKPVHLYFTNPIFTCKFIEVISNVISQIVVSRVLVVYELHITCVRHNSSNIRVHIKWSHGPNPLVSFDVWGEKTKYNHTPILLVPRCVHSDIPE